MKRTILWLEDQPDTVGNELAQLKMMGFNVQFAATPHSFADILENNLDDIACIIIDTMLYGVKSLDTIGIDGVNTDGGLNAGLALIDNFLRPKSKQNKISSIPIVVFSIRRSDEIAKLINLNIKERGGGEIYYLQKGDLDTTKNLIDIIKRQRGEK